ncbi:histidine kinase [Streptomyces sp. A1547]|uniref:histidine kinase n=1 Tax=Streptomyces sp. A1547 TaxID=2563105 RepID=UPI001F0D496A|nr:histidine kinase [Streptomyces sp. A1547]
MQLSAHPAVARLRAALPAVGEIVYAIGSLWISTTMLRNWPDPNGYWRDTDAWAYGLLAAIYLPLVLRRRFPVAVLISTALCTGCYFTLGYYHAVAVCGLALALHTVASLRERRVSARCAVGALLVLLWGTRLAEPGIGPLSVGFVTVTTIVCWVTGDGARRLRELTRQLRREQEEKARRAVMEERIQIARELHDVIAHHVSVISVQTGLAGYVFASDPPTARRALDTIGDSAHEALAEMRRMLLVLREDGRAPAEEEPPRSPGTRTPGWTPSPRASARCSAWSERACPTPTRRAARPQAATVKTHVHRCLSKLGVSSRAQAVVLAHESGLVARLPWPRSPAGRPDRTPSGCGGPGPPPEWVPWVSMTTAAARRPSRPASSS